MICGDFNSWSQEWGSTRNDRRGKQLSDLATSLNLSIENVGTTATYRRTNAESIIDLTFFRLAAPATIRGRRVLDDVESASDHFYVEFALVPTPDYDETDHNRPRGWSYRQLDPAALATHLANTAQPTVSDLTEYLESACNSCMPPRGPHSSRRREAHWWSNDLALLRLSTIKLRRALHRSARRLYKIPM